MNDNDKLGKCADCGTSISRLAEKCTVCGRPDPCGTYARARAEEVAASERSTRLMLAGLGAGLIFLMALCTGPSLLKILRNSSRGHEPTPEELRKAGKLRPVDS